MITLNFGAIYETIKLKLSNDVFNEFVSEINDNLTLKRQQLVFDSFNTPNTIVNRRLAERFLLQTLEIINKQVLWQDVISINRNTRRKYLEDVYVGSTTRKDDLFNSIHTIIEYQCRQIPYTKKEDDAFEYIIEYLMTDRGGKYIEIKDEPKLSLKNLLFQSPLSTFDERYAHLKNEDKKLIKTILYNL